MLLEVAAVDAAARAVRAGCEAIFMNSVLDYGLLQARATTRVPVVGAGQASLLTATALGRRFAIVTVWPASMRHLYERLLATYQLSDRCVAIRFVGDETEVAPENGQSLFTRVAATESEIVQRVATEIEAAVSHDRADVVVLGCTCMSRAAPKLSASSRVPVIDPLATGWAFAEMLSRLGITHSAAAHPEPRTPIDSVVREMLAATPRAGLDQSVDECGGTCPIAAESSEQPAAAL